MTDLTAYEQALVERVARAMHEYDTADPERTWDNTPAVTQNYLRVGAKHILRALGLLGPSRTAWIAPWEATAENGLMLAGRDALVTEESKHVYVADYVAAIFAAMRDAHLKEGGA